ncbi:uncharacterized protein VTP21DRAFT_2792 [Calcarisporiella thermophila]|uniref:uncharacterized protein n=1 Tax=Calcarisporiella thermophila TaxID=911321 RepID=UPI003743C93C
MSLITDPAFLIHQLRVKYLRVDDRIGAKIMSFGPNIMANDYIKTAAPFPETSYCISPVISTEYLQKKQPETKSASKVRALRRKPLLTVPSVQIESEDEMEDTDASASAKAQHAFDLKSSSDQPAQAPAVFVTSASKPTGDLDVNSHSFSPSAPANDINFTRPMESPASPTVTSATPTPSMPFVPPSPMVLPAPIDIRPPVAVSALSAMIAARKNAVANPFAEEYSFFAGKGEPNPMTLKMYLPMGKKQPMIVVVKRDATVEEVIGYTLFQYWEEKRQPPLELPLCSVIMWNMMIAEDDGEIDEDFPALERTRKIRMFSFDQFALQQATPKQVEHNEKLYIQMNKRPPPKPEEIMRSAQPSASSASVAPQTQPPQLQPSAEDIAFTPESAVASSSAAPSTAIAGSTHVKPVPMQKHTLTKNTATNPASHFLKIRLTAEDTEVSHTTTISVYLDMFLGDVLELICRKRRLDPNEYELALINEGVGGGVGALVDLDRTVESLPPGVSELCLVKKSNVSPARSRRQREEASRFSYVTSSEYTTAYKKYTVNRKTPVLMGMGRHERVLAIDGEYIHLMPPEQKFDKTKTSSYHISSVISCKQSKKVPTNFKLMVYKNRDTKAYELEVETAKEAHEICARIQFLIQVHKNETSH